MKSQSWFLVMVLMPMFTLLSQKITDDEILYARAGFKGGMNYATVLGDVESPGLRLRIHLGVVVEYPVFRNFFIEGELLYSAQGYTVDVAGKEQKISMNYISLPILPKYYVTKSISIESGPQFSLLSTLGNEDLEDTDPFYNSFNEFDFSWVVGGGYILESGLFFQARYNVGLTNINNTAVTNRNSVMQVSIGYLFKTKNNRRFIDQE